ncbi:hypothetical protein AB0929_40415, partial [Streptomyces massasporeus]
MSTHHRFTTAALVPALALGMVGAGITTTTVLTTASAAQAAQSGPWSDPVALTGSEGFVNVIDVRAMSDGRVVALWYHTIPATRQLELSVAIRPRTSADWGATTVLDVLPEARESVSLDTASDGSATVTWAHRSGAGLALRTSTLSTGATWSEATDITAGSGIGGGVFAGNSSGKRVAVWGRNVGGASALYVSERQSPD